MIGGVQNNILFDLSRITKPEVEEELLKNLLENEGIKAFLNNEYFGTLFPFNKTPGQGDVRLIVSGQDETKAKLLVEDFERNRLE